MKLTNALVASCLSFLIAAGPAYAQDWSPAPMSEAIRAEIQPRAAEFFERVQANDANAAVNGVLEGSTLSQQTVQITQLVAQTAILLQNTGPIEGMDFIQGECVTPRFCLARYAIYGETSAFALWLYVYRKPNEEWVTQAILVGESPAFFFGE